MGKKLYGSLDNRLEENSFFEVGIDAVKVGMKCTEYYYSDSHVWEIIKILKQDGKNQKFECVVRQMKAHRTDHNGMSDCQSYEFESDPNAPTQLLKISGTKYKKLKAYPIDTKTGVASKTPTSQGWAVNIAREYYDYSF